MAFLLACMNNVVRVKRTVSCATANASTYLTCLSVAPTGLCGSVKAMSSPKKRRNLRWSRQQCRLELSFSHSR